MAEDNQFGFYRDVQLNNGALVVTGITGGSGTSGTSGTSGAPGASGATGSNGSSGTSGAAGSSGTSGAAGSSGSGALGIHFGTPLVGGTLGMPTFGQLYAQGTYTQFNERIFCYPIIPEQNVPYSALTIDQGGASDLGHKAKIVIYNDNGSNYPGTKRYESTTIDLSQGGCCRIHNVLTSATLSAGTMYWVGCAFSGATGSTNSLYQYSMNSLWNIGRPVVNDGWGVVYKFAVSAVFTNFTTLPDPFVTAGSIGFTGGYVIDGYYGGTTAVPAVYIKFAV
jgi:hypothetical protein